MDGSFGSGSFGDGRYVDGKFGVGRMYGDGIAFGDEKFAYRNFEDGR